MIVAACAFLVPVAVDPRTVDVFNLSKLTLIWIGGVTGFAAWAASVILRPQRIGILRHRAIVLSLVLLATTATATLLSRDRELSVFGFYRRYQGLISIALYVGFAVLVVAVYKGRPESLRDLTIAIATASAVVAIVAVLQRIDWVQLRSSVVPEATHPVGTIGNSGFAASYLGISLAFIVYLVLSTPARLLKAAWVCVAAIVLIGLWLMQGAAGLLAAGSGILGLAMFMSRLGGWKKVAVIAALLVGFGVTPLVSPGPIARLQTSLVDSSTVHYRANMARSAARMLLDRPLFGWGPESFFGEFPRYRVREEARDRRLSITDDPHNIYLDWATSTGVAGLAAYLALMGWLLVAAARALGANRGPRLLTATFAAGLTAYLVQGVYSIDVPALAFTGWLLVGSLSALVERPAQGQSQPKKGLGATLAAAVAATIALALLLAVNPIRADHAAWAAERLSRKGWSQEASDLYEKAMSLNPHESAYKVLGAAFFARTAGRSPFAPETSLLRAVGLFEDALRMRPRNVLYMAGLGRLYAEMGERLHETYYEDATRWFAVAAASDPLDPQVHSLYAQSLESWAETERGPRRAELLRRAAKERTLAS